MNAERLNKLADFLDTVNPAHFDLEQFTYFDEESLSELGITRNGSLARIAADVAAIHPCGTTTCAIGFCPVAFPSDWKYINGHACIKHGGDGDFIEGWSRSRASKRCRFRRAQAASGFPTTYPSSANVRFRTVATVDSDVLGESFQEESVSSVPATLEISPLTKVV